MLIDTHAHLYSEAYCGREDEVINYARQMTVEKIICSGSDLETSTKAVALAQKHDGVYASVGVHPQDAMTYSNETELALEKLFSNPKVVAVGEIGLEYRENCPEKDVQRACFIKQILLAERHNKPIVIHTRDAIMDTLEIVKNNLNHLPKRGTFHCFSESVEVAREVLKMGFYISVGGVCTFKNAARAVDVIKEVPLERILLETDCPYLTPVPHRGEVNHSGYIPLIAERVAQIKGIDVETVARVTTENAERLFKI